MGVRLHRRLPLCVDDWNYTQIYQSTGIPLCQGDTWKEWSRYIPLVEFNATQYADGPDEELDKTKKCAGLCGKTIIYDDENRRRSLINYARRD